MDNDEQLREVVAAIFSSEDPDDKCVEWLVADVLDVLGRLGPVTALNLALREHRKRVSEQYDVEIPDQSQWMSERNEEWVEPQGH